VVIEAESAVRGGGESVARARHRRYGHSVTHSPYHMSHRTIGEPFFIIIDFLSYV
jgi:hypothetical protein